MMRRSRSARVAPALLAASVALAACVDFNAVDRQRCVLRGFEKGTKEYQYCLDKLRELREEEDERNQRFLDMLAG